MISGVSLPPVENSRPRGSRSTQGGLFNLCQKVSLDIEISQNVPCLPSYKKKCLPRQNIRMRVLEAQSVWVLCPEFVMDNENRLFILYVGEVECFIWENKCDFSDTSLVENVKCSECSTPAPFNTSCRWVECQKCFACSPGLFCP